jgi:hypothetical protein
LNAKLLLLQASTLEGVSHFFAAVADQTSTVQVLEDVERDRASRPRKVSMGGEGRVINVPEEEEILSLARPRRGENEPDG